MDSDTPIFSSDFISSYGNWLMAIGTNSTKLLLYITFNCLFIVFFERIANPDIAFGDILENAPYYFISANDFRVSDSTKRYDRDGKASISERKRQRAQAPSVYDVMYNDNSDKLIDRIIPRLFRIDKITALPPYNYIAMPEKCRNEAVGDCNTSISKDTYLSYFITIITFIMWGYRQGFKMFSFWNTVLINQSPSLSSIWYQICIKFLLMLGWLVFLIITLFTFFYSIMWGIYAIFFEHYPKASLYKCGNIIPFYLGPIASIGNFFIRIIWYLLLCLFQVIVAIVALFTGILMWAPLIGPISWSIGMWIFYPIIETMFYNFANSYMAPFFGYSGTKNVKNFKSVVKLIGDIYKRNIQFLMFLIVIIFYYSSMTTMDPDFTNGVGMVLGSIGAILLFKAIMSVASLFSK
jgi:hypothetical protein